MAKSKPKPAAKPKPTAKKAAPKEEKFQSPSELLSKINGFESAVAQLKYLKDKVAANSENKVLNKSFNAQLQSVNTIINSISMKVI